MTVAPRAAGAAMLCALLVLAGCGSAPASGGPDPVFSAAPLSTAAPASSGPGSASDLTLAFAGDVHFMERTATLLAKDPSTAFGPVAQVLSSADVAMVNLETAVTTRGTPEPKQFHFRAPASAYGALRAAGVDVATIANNHSLDYGLGNFLWWYDDAFSNDTGVLKITLRDKIVVGSQLVPAVISRTTGQPLPVDGAEAARISKKFTDLRKCTGLASVQG